MKVFEMFARRGLGLLSLSLRCRFAGIDFFFFFEKGLAWI